MAEACSRCQEPGPVEAHHPDYSEPDRIEWLCFPCHKAEHVAQRRAAKLARDAALVAEIDLLKA